MMKEKHLKGLKSNLNTITNHYIPTVEGYFGIHPYEYELTPGMQDKIDVYLEELQRLAGEYKALLEHEAHMKEEKFIASGEKLQAELEKCQRSFEKPRRIRKSPQLQKLIEKHPDKINLKGRDGKTLLIEFAVRKQGPEFLALLLENGADINAQGDLNSPEQGNSALHWCIANAYVPKALWLIENGPKYNINYDLLGHGQTALHLAIAKGPNHVTDSPKGKVQDGFRKIITGLIDNGADVNMHDDRNSFTPLHLAVLHRDKKTILLLLKNNANPEAKDNLGRTPFDLLELPYDQTEEIIKKQSGVYTLTPKEEWENKELEIKQVFGQSVTISSEETTSESIEAAPITSTSDILNLLKTHAAALNQSPKAIAIENFIEEYKLKQTSKEKLDLVEKNLQNPDGNNTLLVNTGTGFYKFRNIFFPRKHFNSVDSRKHLSNSKTEDLLLELRTELKHGDPSF